LNGKHREAAGVEAEASPGGQREVVFLEVDADDATGARIEVLAQIANEPAGLTCGPDILPLGFADLPASLGHGLGQRNNAASEIRAAFFDLDHATREGVVQTLPAAFERLIRANEKEEEIHDVRSDQAPSQNKSLHANPAVEDRRKKYLL